MQIPRETHHFSEPTLLVLADSVKAQFWLAHEDQLEEVDTLEVPKELKSDNEGSFVNTDNGAVNASEPRLDEERVRKLIQQIKQRTEQLVQEDAAEKVILVMEPELLHSVKAALPAAVLEKCKRELPMNLMKEHVLKVVERVFA